MCEHNWEKIERPWQHLINKAEKTSFLNSKVWKRCKKCFAAEFMSVGTLATRQMKIDDFIGAA